MIKRSTIVRQAALAAFLVWSPGVVAQQLTAPVYRVAKESRETATAAAATDDWFDLEQREGEHPLAPCTRIAKRCLAHIDTNIRDYSCNFYKIERIDGALADPQQMYMQTLHQPFSVYLRFLQPYKGRECLYVEGANENKLIALGHGWRRHVGQVNLDPTGSMAMNGQRYPITKAGIRNLTAELIQIAEHDMQFAECEVTSYPNVKVDGRAAVMIEATHPVPRRDFRFHLARIYVDREYKVPVAFEAYSWPKQPGGKPVLEEKYVYTNLKFNNGFTQEDFNPQNPNIFR